MRPPEGTGTLVLLGLAGIWWWRHRSAPNLGAATNEQLSAVAAQLRRAHSRASLASYTRAEASKKFWKTETTDGGAYAATAYWLAVASRMSGDKELLRRASANFQRAREINANPLAWRKSDRVIDIYREAAEAVSGAATRTGSADLRGIAKLLGHQGQEPSIEAARARNRETSLPGQVQDSVAANIDDVWSATTRVSQSVRGVFTGERPTGMDAWTWFATKWGVRVGVGVALLLGARWYFAPALGNVRRPERLLDVDVGEVVARKSREVSAALRARGGAAADALRARGGELVARAKAALPPSAEERRAAEQAELEAAIERIVQRHLGGAA